MRIFTPCPSGNRIGTARAMAMNQLIGVVVARRPESLPPRFGEHRRSSCKARLKNDGAAAASMIAAPSDKTSVGLCQLHLLVRPRPTMHVPRYASAWTDCRQCPGPEPSWPLGEVSGQMYSQKKIGIEIMFPKNSTTAHSAFLSSRTRSVRNSSTM